MAKDNLPVTRVQPLATLPANKRRTAQLRAMLLQPVLDKERAGTSRNAAIDWLLSAIECGAVSDQLVNAAQQLGRNGKPPTRSTLHNWLKAYHEHGAHALAGNHNGRQRRDYGWELRAQHLYNKPSKPAVQAVAEKLQEEGFDSATYPRVRRYLQSLPKHLAINSTKRLGPKIYRDTQKHYHHRDLSVLKPGFIYQGDGHRCDVYIAHPNTGKPWRPELTAWMDVPSRYIVGWYICEDESAINTLISLSHAMLQHDHVPAMLHIDNGAGFLNQLMSDASVGFYERFDIQVMNAIPGNAKGKAQIERWFGTLETQFGKFWDSFCGADMAEEVKSQLIRDVHAGKLRLPSLAQFIERLRDWIDRYNNRVHTSLNGRTPAEVWAEREQTQLHISADAMIRPRVQRTVVRSAVALHNRSYYHAELIAYNGNLVTIEYSLHNDATVDVRDVNTDALICTANLVKKKAYLPESRIAEAQQKRLTGQRKRLQKKLDEAEARSRDSIESQGETILELSNFETPALEQQPGQSLDDWLINDAPGTEADDIDFLDINY